MKDRLDAARRLKKYADDCKEGSVPQELALKCYRACVMSMLKHQTGFSVTFKGKHYLTFPERVKDYSRYIKNKVKATLFPKKKNFYNCWKPLKAKFSNTPNEWLLEDILKNCGFRIKSERMNLADITYYIEQA